MPWSKIGYTNAAVPRYRSWNPGGFGCSGDCGGCWARAMARRFTKCDDCRAFRVHLHNERLDQPKNTKKPAFVLANFTNDWLDRQRSDADVLNIGNGMRAGERHTFITLTKQSKRLRAMTYAGVVPASNTIYHGLTIRNQSELDAKWPVFQTTLGNLWLSLEPLQSAVDLTPCRGRIAGVIVGHDNRRYGPGAETLAHIRSVVQQCKELAIPCYVKQAWWVGRLRREVATLPTDLQIRQLPWEPKKP